MSHTRSLEAPKLGGRWGQESVFYFYFIFFIFVLRPDQKTDSGRCRR